VGARLRADDLPVSPQLRQAATAWGLDPLELCLAPSDDYELVLTCPPEAGPALAQAWSALTRVPLTAVGVVTAERGKVELIGADGHPRRLQAAGWDHFG
jgi:thiamine monophosphate kinase